ncbi:hypothetical protein Droror1_Dr00021373 [Drosera rotundifolia]
MENVFKDLERFYDELIEQHREQQSRPRVDSGHKDLVDVLLEVQADHNQALVLSKDQIKGILLDILIGGTDTSSTTLVWAMTELIKVSDDHGSTSSRGNKSCKRKRHDRRERSS